jgi:hypothetical protein
MAEVALALAWSATVTGLIGVACVDWASVGGDADAETCFFHSQAEAPAVIANTIAAARIGEASFTTKSPPVEPARAGRRKV